MSSEEVMMEAIRELGEPEHLAKSDRLVVLKLDGLWAVPETAVPQDVFFDSDAKRFTMTQEAFVSNGAFFAKFHFVAAAFAACDEFSTPVGDFLEIAKEVLEGARTLVLVHNRNCISDLVQWFPTVTTLVLYHDLRLHANQDFRRDGDTAAGRLEHILGTTPALGCEHLYFCPITVGNMLASFPKLSLIGTPVQDVLMTSCLDYFPKSWPVFKDVSHLVLGCTIHRQGNKWLTTDAISAASMPIAHHCFPNIRSLQLTFASAATLAHVVRFSGLTQLSLIAPTVPPSHLFSPSVVALLARLPLEHLSLTNFSGISVSALATTCTGLKSLALLAGSAAGEYIEDTIFPRLRRLRLSCAMSQQMLLAMLRACPDLVELHLEEDSLSGNLLTGPGLLASPRPNLAQLEQLTLRTRPPGCNSVVDLRVSPADLDAALTALPALRLVRTDNFKIRFHVEKGATRRQPIALEWCVCTKCLVEYPKVSPKQKELWEKAHYKRVGMGVAASGMMMP